MMIIIIIIIIVFCLNFNKKLQEKQETIKQKMLK